MTMRCAYLLLPAGLFLMLAGQVGGQAGGDKEKKAGVFPKKIAPPPAPSGGAGGGKEIAVAGPANSPPPGMVEVRFTNGSVVIMTLLQDKIDIVTEYGRLTVPPRDIRSIEFGFHATEEDQRKLDEAIQHLGSTVHAERETAVQELVALGPLAFLRLHSTVKSKDLEVSRRAESALKTIREKYPARLLRTREDDVVRTGKFNIVGRIITPSLKAKADDFGDLELRPARLLAIRWFSGDTKKEVVVDAGTYGGPGNNKWMATGVRLEPHVGVRLTATGQVDLLPQQGGQRVCGPDGAGGMAMGNKGVRFFNPNNGGQIGGELMGRVGDSGPMFFIGSRHTLTPKTGGQLFLMIQQSPWGCPSAGEYRVTVASGPLMDDGETED